MAGNAEAVLDIRTDSGKFLSDIEKSEKASLGLGKTFQQVAKHAEEFGKRARDVGSVLRDFASGAKTVGIGLTAAVTAPILAAGAAAIKFGMDAVESENLVSVSFGDMKAAADAWSKDLSKSLGLNEFELRKTAGTIFNMTTSMGIAKDKAFEMSTGVAKLAADMASFRNIPMEEALLKIRSGLTGETEPLKAIGILVDEATTKQEAYSTGIAKTGTELTQQQKVMARWSAILRQTANDQGDLARTMDSPANQLRIMKTRLEEAATALGVSLMPMFQRLVTEIGNLVPYIQRAVKWFAELPDPMKTSALAIVGLTAALGPAIFLMGQLAESVARLIPLLKVLSGFKFVGLLGGTGAAGLGAAALVAGAGAVLMFNQRLGEMEASAAAASEPIKTLGGDLKYTLDQAKKAADALPAMGTSFMFMGKAMNVAAAAGRTGFAELDKTLSDARKEIAGLSSGEIASLTRALKSGVVGMDDLKKQTGLSDTAIGLFKKQLEDTGKTASAELAKKLKDLDTTLQPIAGHFVTITAQAAEYGDEAMKLVTQAAVLGVKVPQSVREIAAAWNASELTDLMRKTVAGWLKDLDKFNEEGAKRISDAADRMAAAIIKNDAIMRDRTRGATEVTQQRTLNPFALQLVQIQQWVKEQRAAVDTMAANAKAAFAAIDAEAQARAATVAQAWIESLQKIEDETNSWRNLFIDWLGQIPGLLKQAFTGGGGLAGGLKAMFSGLGGMVGSKLFEAGGPLNQIGNKLSLKLGDMFGKSVGTAFGLALPGIGAAVGSLVGPLVGKIGNLFGKIFHTEEKEVNRTRQAFVDAAGGIDALNRKAQAAGVSLDAMLKAKTVKDYQKAIEDLNAALAFQQEAMADLDATIKKYKFSIKELGPALERQNLDKLSQEIFHDWKILAAAGIDLVAIAREMGESINDFVQRAIASGFEVPEAMRPILQEMIRLGQLTDAAGNKITDLDKSGIHFSMTMTEGFQALIRAVDRLTRAIGRALGITIDLGDAIGNLPAFPTPPNVPGEPTPPTREAAGDFVRVMRPHTFRVDAGEHAFFSGANDQFSKQIAAHLASLMPTPSAAHAGAVSGPMKIVMEVDGRVLGEVSVDGLHAGGPGHTKLKTLVKRMVN